jgi:hypothetical protein
MAERRRTRSVEDVDDDRDRRRLDAEDGEEFTDQDEDELGLSADADGEDDSEAAVAEQYAPRSRGRRSGADGRQSRRRRSPPPQHAGLTVKEAAKAALEQIMDLTAKPAESITGVERTEDGWRIGIEVVEDRRIPSSADILATYRAEVNEDGQLMSYHRIRRYPRGRGDSSEGS